MKRNRGYFFIMKRNRGFFRDNCLAAKGRLGVGFWSEAMQQRDASIALAVQLGNNKSDVANRFIKQLRNSVQQQKGSSIEDEQLYNKVSMFLGTTPNGNPLASVLNREYMMTLGDTERERYVFMLSDQVRKCVQRFEQEKEFTQTKIAR